MDSIGWDDGWLLLTVDDRVCIRVPKTDTFSNQPWMSFCWRTATFVRFDTVYWGDVAWLGNTQALPLESMTPDMGVTTASFHSGHSLPH
jgi:hypothetical protein